MNIINNNTLDISSSSVMANGIIDTHLVSSNTPNFTNRTQFSHQRNSVRALSSSIWHNHPKVGNIAHSHMIQSMPQHERTCEKKNIEVLKHYTKTSSVNSMVESSTKQTSCKRNSRENATQSSKSRDDGVEYRLYVINNRRMNGAEVFNDINNISASSIDHFCNNPQMPSSSSSNVHESQQFIIPVSLTNNVVAESCQIEEDALRCNNNSSNNDNLVNINRMSVVECQNQQIIDNEDIKSAVDSNSVIITSAIDTNPTSSSSTPSKTKYSNEIVTLRGKRRRNRRDRRLARIRALSASGSTNEILPDILNNPRPPPYSSLPPIPQQIPSIISTVPVENTRYTFSLPLVRR